MDFWKGIGLSDLSSHIVSFVAPISLPVNVVPYHSGEQSAYDEQQQPAFTTADVLRSRRTPGSDERYVFSLSKVRDDPRRTEGMH